VDSMADALRNEFLNKLMRIQIRSVAIATTREYGRYYNIYCNEYTALAIHRIIY